VFIKKAGTFLEGPNRKPEGIRHIGRWLLVKLMGRNISPDNFRD
jgi:hypothetical protein